MKYVCSDIHGCFDKYDRLLKKLNLTNKDKLYILGDVADRGEDGIKIYFDMMKHKYIIPLVGNHEIYVIMAIKALIAHDGIKPVEEVYDFEDWFADGGKPTLEALKRLNAAELNKLYKYLASFSFCEFAYGNNQKFYLSHSLPKYKENMHLRDINDFSILYERPDYDKRYFEDKITVTGHTPTGLIDENCKGKVYFKNNHLAIDCGAAFGFPLGCVNLETLEEIYIG